MSTADDLIPACLYRFRFGATQFDESRFELSVGGLTVDIEQKPLQVLVALLRQPDRLVSREELFESVWAARVTGEQVLTNAVAKLRKALGESDGARIVTVPRSGYRFTGPIERVAVGMRLATRLDLKAGQSVPGRENFLLDIQLATSAGAEVWLAKHPKSADARVFKFARAAEHLGTLKREVTLSRLLREALGEREDLLRILDWNFESFPFYLESDYGGSNLLQWAEEEKQLGALSQSARLNLFLQIADAVAAAHSVGVLHKDLKPTNVLIASRADGSVQARVTDFGAGQLMEPERLIELGITQLGMTATQGIFNDSGLGTPLYLAPELIAGEPATVRSDVFALGLLLYQLLSGDLRKPMASGWEQTITDDLLAEDIAAATHGDPSCRLSGVAELTQRLHSLAVRRAQRESTRIDRERAALAERVLERARIRRPWIVTALLVLLVGIGISYSLYHRERLTRLEAQNAATRAEAINQFLSEDLLGAADPTGLGGADNPTVRQVLSRTAATLDTRFAADPQTKASIELALGNAYYGLSDYAAAEKYQRNALQLLNVSQGEDNPVALEAAYKLAVILEQTSRFDEAAVILKRTDRLAGFRLKENSRLAFEQHWAWGDYYRYRWSALEALAEFTAADRIRVAISPNDDKQLLRVRSRLGWCYARLGRTTDAERLLHEIVSPRYTPARVTPVLWGGVRLEYAAVLITLQRYSEAEEILIQAQQELRHSLDSDHSFVVSAQNQLGELYMRRAQWLAALDAFREAYRIAELRLGEHAQKTLTSQYNIGIVEYRMGQVADAVKILAPVHTQFVDTLGETNPESQVSAFYLACAQRDLHHYTEALTLLAHLEPAALAEAELRNDWRPRLMALRGAILLGQGHKADARALLEPAVAEMQQDHTSAQDLDPFRGLL